MCDSYPRKLSKVFFRLSPHTFANLGSQVSYKKKKNKEKDWMWKTMCVVHFPILLYAFMNCQKKNNHKYPTDC